MLSKAQRQPPAPIPASDLPVCSRSHHGRRVADLEGALLNLSREEEQRGTALAQVSDELSDNHCLPRRTLPDSPGSLSKSAQQRYAFTAMPTLLRDEEEAVAWDQIPPADRMVGRVSVSHLGTDVVGVGCVQGLGRLGRPSAPVPASFR